MEIIDPRLVEEASKLPSAVLLLSAAVGPVFWVLGWRIHRGLFVAAATIAGGVYGLVHGPALGLYSGVAALLLSLSIGGLALALLRIGTFVAVGALVAVGFGRLFDGRLEADSFRWVQVTAFLGGGLLSLVCYRFLVIALTSFVGAFLLLLGGLAFAHRQGEADTIALAGDRPAIIATAFIALGVLGTVGQYLAERRRGAASSEPKRDPAKSPIRDTSKGKGAKAAA
jgi:hypothetical protein